MGGKRGKGRREEGGERRGEKEGVISNKGKGERQ